MSGGGWVDSGGLVGLGDGLSGSLLGFVGFLMRETGKVKRVIG